MNYLAHGYRFLDTPLFAAGTAVPDWLCVADRRVRMRSRRLIAQLPLLKRDDQQLAAGILQHLQDDDRFHRSGLFLMLESEIGLRFRRQMPDVYDHRPGFLGHIVTELMLDAFLAEQRTELLDRYYDVLSEVNPEMIQDVVNLVGTRQTDQLAWFVAQFSRVKFLYDYLDDRQLLGRLNQVLHRVTLPVLDEQCLSVLQDARILLWQHGEQLLQEVEAVEVMCCTNHKE